MGSKTAARQLAIRAGTPVVPGTTEPLRVVIFYVSEPGVPFRHPVH